MTSFSFKPRDSKPLPYFIIIRYTADPNVILHNCAFIYKLCKILKNY